MRRLLPLLLAAGCAAPPPAPRGLPAAIRAEGVPEIPADFARRLAQYEAARGASFQDWGPDGSILIATRFAETAQLHLVPFPGGRREQLTFSEEPVSGGIWIPGTDDLLYLQARGGDENAQVYRLERKSGRSLLLTDGRSRHGLGPLNRKGDRVVLSSNRRNGRDTDLFLLDPRSGAIEPLLEVKGQFWSATDWAPDDSRLLLLRGVSVNESYPHVMDLKTRMLTPISIPGGARAAHDALRFASGGDRILLASDAGAEFRRLARVDPATGAYVWTERPWDVTDIEVSGAREAVVRNEDGVSTLSLSDGPPLDLPAGVISGLRFSPDGRRLGFTLSRADAPSDAYTWEIEERRLVRWTFSETGGLPASGFTVPTRFSYPTFDGRDVPAYLYRPRGAARAPVLISIHGGPESQFRPFFSPRTQHWVNELGLAVIAPNVRGSTGYGKTYVALDNAEKREDSVKDIGALLDWIARQPDLDASRVAVVGGSYGGYMVLASLVHYGDRIRAGIDVVGIANFRTFLEKTSGYRVDLRRVEYGDERDPAMQAVFDRISPANHADRIRSALLVAHGKNDPRVPFAEAEQIAAKVRARGRPVWTVYADNEGHGFARKENAVYLDAAQALFLKQHLLD